MGLIIMSAYLFFFMILGRQPLYVLLSLGDLLLLFFFGVLFKFKCTKCINFSCVFNRVPKRKVDAYLKRNPVMADAWERAGWQIENDKIS